MRILLRAIAAAMFFALPGLALAQTDTHHSAAQTQMMSPEMMQSMMKMMQNCMGMMQMMQTGMGQGMPMRDGMQGNMPMLQGGMSDARPPT
jgi:hypothetical protein